MENKTLIDRALLLAELSRIIESAEDPEAVKALLEETERGVAHKVDSYYWVMDALTNESDRLHQQAKDMARAADSIGLVAEKMRDRIKVAMRLIGTEDLRGQAYRFKLSRAKSRLLVNQDNLSPKLMMAVTKYEPDKDKIRELLEAGVPVPGASLEESWALRSYINKNTLTKTEKTKLNERKEVTHVQEGGTETGPIKACTDGT